MQKKRILQILITSIIFIAVGAIYFIKNPPTNQKEKSPVSISDNINLDDDQEQDNADERGAQADKADFSLLATEAIDFEAMEAYGFPMIIDYGSDSCIPCKEMAPVLEKMNEEMENKAFIKFVDVWKYTDAANNVPVQVIPTQVLVNADGTPFVPSEELASQMEFVQYTSKDTGEHVFTVHQGGLTEEQMRMILVEMGVTE